METDLGSIVIEIDTARAPNTGANFLRYVDAGLYDGGLFYRSVTMHNQPDDEIRIEVIQGGIDPARSQERFPEILLERTHATGLRHLDGTISVARAGPDTGSSEIFICIGDQPELDFGGRRNPDGQGFAAFGRVVRGMDVVREIHQQPVEGQRLVKPVGIESVRRGP
jgi:peptidyl-prolyl cis-trans isomerase A (cyclophilin A)